MGSTAMSDQTSASSAGRLQALERRGHRDANRAGRGSVTSSTRRSPSSRAWSPTSRVAPGPKTRLEALTEKHGSWSRSRDRGRSSGRWLLAAGRRRVGFAVVHGAPVAEAGHDGPNRHSSPSHRCVVPSPAMSALRTAAAPSRPGPRTLLVGLCWRSSRCWSWAPAPPVGRRPRGGAKLLHYQRVWPDGRIEQQTIFTDGRIEMKHGEFAGAPHDLRRDLGRGPGRAHGSPSPPARPMIRPSGP